MYEILIFLLGFILLIKGADFLIEGASSIARKLDVPDLVVGLTIISFGTSVAELFVNLVASVQNNNDIVIGNILGSNIFNSSIILGISAIIFPLKVKDTTVWKEIPLSMLAAVAFIIVANDQIIDSAQVSVISRIDGFVFLLFFMIFMHYTISLAREHRRLFEEEVPYKGPIIKAVIFIILGLGALIVGGQWVVRGAVAIAAKMNVSNSLISLTIVAAGTSMPELATSTVAAFKKKPDIAVANIVGSNIFNIFFILGISALINPVEYNRAQNFDAIICMLVSVLMFLFMFTLGKKSFDRKEGILLILIYAAYVSYLVLRG